MDKQRFLDAILRQFNNDELKLLCFDLGLDRYQYPDRNEMAE